MRKAFTMIELIFIIVIIGILSAIAIPKLTATKNDAEISKMMAGIDTAMQEISAYAVSHQAISDDLSEMSGSIDSMVERGDASLNTSLKKVTIEMGNVTDCVSLQIYSQNGNEDINISYGNAGSDELCRRLQNSLNTKSTSVPLRGVRIVF